MQDNVIPTGCTALDLAIGTGGYPRGRVTEIFGPEASGKTTLALHAITEAQRRGGVAAFIDAEHTLDIAYAKKIGVDVDALLVAQPDGLAQALDVVTSLVRSGAVDLVVVDSVAALVPQAEIDGGVSDLDLQARARLMSQALRTITSVASRTGCAVIFLNQPRPRPGVTTFAGVTVGGNALKFYASLRLEVRGVEEEEEENGTTLTQVMVVKNKLAPPFKTVRVNIVPGCGICEKGEEDLCRT